MLLADWKEIGAGYGAGAPVLLSESEPLQAIIHAWLKRLPTRYQAVLDYQLQNLPSRYFQSLDVQGVQLDFTLIERLSEERVIVTATEIPGRVTLRVLMAKDEPRIFLRVVAALAAHHVHIERALIFTGKKDGVVMDHFILRPTQNPEQLAQAVAQVRESLLNGTCAKPEIFHPIHFGLRALIESNAKDHTTLTVFAEDQVGFLYRLAHVFVDLKLDVHFANLKTHGGQIIDSFHLTKDGTHLGSQDEALLRTAIFQAFSGANPV